MGKSMGDVIEAGALSAPEAPPAPPADEDEPAPDDAPPARRPGRIVDWLRQKTGKGDLSDYLKHAANPTGDEHGARIARGLSGLFGGLDFALLDVFMGLWGLAKQSAEKAKGAAPGGVQGG